jgi:protein phosphatase
MRSNNEDSARIVPELGLFVIADGMGGHVAGEVASQVAADTIAAAVASQPTPRRIRDQQDIMRNAIVEANDAVVREGARRSLLGMGTTLTALRITSRTATISHVGDTRAYFVRAKTLDPLTTDHTMVSMLVAMGAVRPEEAIDHPDKHLLTQAIGTQGEIEPQVVQKRIPRSCRILLSSDGLHDYVAPEDIHAIACGDNLCASAKELVAAANALGGPDNVTVILIDPNCVEPEGSSGERAND